MILRLCVLILGVFSPQLAGADSFGDWEFDPPESYEGEATNRGMTYKGPNGFFLFTASQPTNGKRLETLAPRLISDVTTVPPAGQNALKTLEPEPGTKVWLAIASDGKAAYIAAVHLHGNRVATALFVPKNSDVDEEQTALLETVFTPEDGTITMPQPAAPSAWPAPLADRTATTRPRLSAAAADSLGLDPDNVPLPVGFSCFAVDEPRALTPEPDLRISFAPNFTYSMTDGKKSAKGTWAMGSSDVFDHMVTFTGPMDRNDRVLIRASDLGQSFEARHPFTDDGQDLECRQDGPAVEDLVQSMAAVAVTQGFFDCTDTDGRSYKLLFGNGTYKVPEGYGSLGFATKSFNGNRWEMLMDFASGPLSLFDATVSAVSPGSLKLELTTEWHSGNMFYSHSETKVHAVCLMNTLPRQNILYGQDAPPPAPAPNGGLPEGLFWSFESYNVFSNNMFLTLWHDQLTFVAPGGRMIHGVDLDEIGALPDCTRSRPDGFAFCGDYRIKGKTILRRDAGAQGESDWDEAEPFSITKDGFIIGDVAFSRLQPLSVSDLTGTWVAASFSAESQGVGGQSGFYTGADVWWTFTPEGRFEWGETRSHQTIISPDPILGGASGGGFSSTQDGGAGRYAFDGLWLDLIFDDGRKMRHAVLGQTSKTGLSLAIDGNDLKLR